MIKKAERQAPTMEDIMYHPEQYPAAILPSAYGVLLEAEEHKHGLSHGTLSGPESIETEDGFQAVQTIAETSMIHGANIAAINTFGKRGLLLKNSPEDRELYQLNVAEGLRAIREAQTRTSSDIIGVIGSFGPFGECYEAPNAPYCTLHAHDNDDNLVQLSNPQASEIIELHKEQIRLTHDIDPTIIPWFETVPDLSQALLIAKVAKEMNIEPVEISFTIQADGTLRDGETFNEALHQVIRVNPMVRVGLNCCPIEGIEKALKSCSPDALKFVSAIYANATSLPPESIDGTEGDVIINVQDPVGTANYLNYLAKAYHIQIIGGCCGYTFKEIAAIRHAISHGAVSHIAPFTELNPKQKKFQRRSKKKNKEVVEVSA